MGPIKEKKKTKSEPKNKNKNENNKEINNSLKKIYITLDGLNQIEINPNSKKNNEIQQSIVNNVKTIMNNKMGKTLNGFPKIVTPLFGFNKSPLMSYNFSLSDNFFKFFFFSFSICFNFVFKLFI